LPDSDPKRSNLRGPARGFLQRSRLLFLSQSVGQQQLLLRARRWGALVRVHELYLRVLSRVQIVKSRTRRIPPNRQSHTRSSVDGDWFLTRFRSGSRINRRLFILFVKRHQRTISTPIFYRTHVCLPYFHLQSWTENQRTRSTSHWTLYTLVAADILPAIIG